MEILAGLQQDQPVIANPPDSLTDGEEVRIVLAPGSKPGQIAEAKP
jgi:hypothetical protein